MNPNPCFTRFDIWTVLMSAEKLIEFQPSIEPQIRASTIRPFLFKESKLEIPILIKNSVPHFKTSPF